MTRCAKTFGGHGPWLRLRLKNMLHLSVTHTTARLIRRLLVTFSKIRLGNMQELQKGNQSFVSLDRSNVFVIYKELCEHIKFCF